MTKTPPRRLSTPSTWRPSVAGDTTFGWSTCGSEALSACPGRCPACGRGRRCAASLPIPSAPSPWCGRRGRWQRKWPGRMPSTPWRFPPSWSRCCHGPPGRLPARGAPRCAPNTGTVWSILQCFSLWEKLAGVRAVLRLPHVVTGVTGQLAAEMQRFARPGAATVVPCVVKGRGAVVPAQFATPLRLAAVGGLVAGSGRWKRWTPSPGSGSTALKPT